MNQAIFMTNAIISNTLFVINDAKATIPSIIVTSRNICNAITIFISNNFMIPTTCVGILFLSNFQDCLGKKFTFRVVCITNTKAAILVVYIRQATISTIKIASPIIGRIITKSVTSNGTSCVINEHIQVCIKHRLSCKLTGIRSDDDWIICLIPVTSANVAVAMGYETMSTTISTIKIARINIEFI